MHWLLGGYMWLFIHRPFECWSFLGTLQVERIYMILTLLYWAVVAPKGWAPNGLHICLIAFFGILLTSWVCGLYMEATQITVENYCKVMVFYLLVVTTVRDEKDLKRLLALYLVAVGLYMCHSLLEYANGRYQWRMGIRRMVGVDQSFGDPNAFASTLVVSLPLTLPFWACRPTRRTRMLLGCFAGGVCLSVALTGSRAGFVGLLLCGSLCLIAMGWRIRSVVLMGCLAGLAAMALPGELQDRFLTLIDSSYGPANAQESAEGRIAGLMAGWQAFLRSPLLGHGPASFTYATGSELNAHNVYGQVISELGALGVLAFVGILFGFARNVVEAQGSARPGRRGNFPLYAVRALGIVVILMCVLGWAGHNLYRYFWQWFAAFQIIALHCLRTSTAAVAWRPHLPRARMPRPLPRPRLRLRLPYA